MEKMELIAIAEKRAELELMELLEDVILTREAVVLRHPRAGGYQNRNARALAPILDPAC